ncbi:hypothetical protein FIM04_05020, partial [SAR202 cluster bacterium AC-409-J13_OGT_754m]|nr:hypothetical protein [SAR202 cluster bacterium AC-409-J13_OGT_754m]
MIRYIALLTVTLLLTGSCSGSSDSGTAQVGMSAPTVTQVPAISTPTVMDQPTPKSSPEKKSTTSDAAPQISCVLSKEENQITCVSTNIKEGSQMKWTSTASYAYGGGSKWKFTIDQPVGSIEQVFLDICEGSTCQTFETSIDTSELVVVLIPTTTATKVVAPTATPMPSAPTPASVGTQKDTILEIPATPTGSTPKETLSAPPVLSLPFTIDQEPPGMMPMGETILHPVTINNPNGHPGIDFQWPYRAEIVSATNGEVLEIRTSAMASKQQGSILYYVAVMSGDFVVTYDILDIYLFNPDLVVGSKIETGQVMGYPNPAGEGEWNSIHWAFGKWFPGSEEPNPEGIVEKFRIDYMCAVPYFSEAERVRLFRLWDAAQYPNAGGF